MNFRKNLEDKSKFLRELGTLSIDDLWREFSLLQVDLFYQQEIKVFSNKNWWKAATKILDMGCRTGYFSYKLLEKEPLKHFLGIDILSKNIEYANKHFCKDKLHFKMLNYKNFISELENQFDVIILRMTLQHLKDPKKVLSHAFRYLRAKGRVIIIDSCDFLRKYSYATPCLDQAIQNLNLKNEKSKRGNRLTSFNLQKAINNKEDKLSDCYEIDDTNLTMQGNIRSTSKEFIIRGGKENNLYFLYNLLFLQILDKEWKIEIDFEKAYDEARVFFHDEKAWLRSGKHYLILKKKNSVKASIQT